MPSTTAFSGGATRMFHLYQRVIDRGGEVTVIAPVAQGREADLEALERGGWKVLPSQRPASRIAELLAAVLRHPSLLVGALRLPTLGFLSRVLWMPMRAIAQRELSSGDYDVLVVEHDYAAPWIDDLTGKPTALLELHNITSEYSLSSASELRGPRRWFQLFDARRYRRLAERAIPKYDALVFVTDEERELLAAQVAELTERRWTVECGADRSAFATERDDSDEPVVIMTGSMNYPPNARAVEWFVAEIWPRVRAAVPDARFFAVGRDPLPELQALGGRDGVEVTGTVPSTLPYFERAQVCVVPLRSGAGMKLKIGEAFLARRALVSTTLGASGVHAEDRREFVLADDPESFAAAVIELLSDCEKRRAIARAGHEFGLRNLEWSLLGDRLADALESLVATEVTDTITHR